MVDGTDITIVSDEVYEHIIFDGARHESMARHDALRARSFIVGSFGKTYHVTGWKVGYVVAPAALTTEFRKVHQFVTFSTHHAGRSTRWPSSSIRSAAIPELSAFYQRKRDLFLELIAGSRWKPLPSRGTYFQLLDYSAITDEGDMDFALRLTREHGVASIPTSAFLYKQAPPMVAAVLFREEGRDAARRRPERLKRLLDLRQRDHRAAAGTAIADVRPAAS